MEEVQLIGEKAFVHMIEATQYFEIVRLQEILDGADQQYFASNAEEYEQKRTLND
jgi:hypothetical protein